MEERIAEFLQQASVARERADLTNGELKSQWLRIAEMWELLAHEHRGLHSNANQKN